MDQSQFDAFNASLLAPRLRGARHKNTKKAVDIRVPHAVTVQHTQRQQVAPKPDVVASSAARDNVNVKTVAEPLLTLIPDEAKDDSRSARAARRRERNQRKEEEKARVEALQRFTSSENIVSISNKSTQKRKKVRVAPLGEVFEEDLSQLAASPAAVAAPAKPPRVTKTPSSANKASPMRGIFQQARRSTFVSTPSPTPAAYSGPAVVIPEFSESNFYSPATSAEKELEQQQQSVQRRKNLVDMITDGIVNNDSMIDEMERQQQEASEMVDKIWAAVINVQRK